jgi:hypothetical protein
MPHFPRLTLLAVAAALAVSLPGAAPKQSNLVPYPEGFRSWTHVKSAVNEPHPPFGRYVGMYHIYANARALRGYRTGRFEDGSVIVYDMKKSETRNHNIQSAGRHFTDVMVKNSRRYQATGGWGYEEFEGDSRDIRTVSTAKGEMSCQSCHVTQRARDFVFSSIAD